MVREKAPGRCVMITVGDVDELALGQPATPVGDGLLPVGLVVWCAAWSAGEQLEEEADLDALFVGMA